MLKWRGQEGDVEKYEIWPAKMIQQAKFSLPIKDKSSLLRHFMEVVPINIPRKTKRVVEPSSLLGARGMAT